MLESVSPAGLIFLVCLHLTYGAAPNMRSTIPLTQAKMLIRAHDDKNFESVS